MEHSRRRKNLEILQETHLGDPNFPEHQYSTLSVLPMLLSGFNVSEAVVKQVVKELDAKRNLPKKGLPDALLTNMTRLLAGYDGTKGQGTISSDVAKLPMVMIPLGRKTWKDAQCQKNILGDIMKAGVPGEVRVSLSEAAIKISSADGSVIDEIRYDKSGAIAKVTDAALERIGMSCSRLCAGKSPNFMYGAAMTGLGDQFTKCYGEMIRTGGKLGSLGIHAKRNIAIFRDHIVERVAMQDKSDAHVVGLQIYDCMTEGKGGFYERYLKEAGSVKMSSGPPIKFTDLVNQVAIDIQTGTMFNMQEMSVFCEAARVSRKPAEDATKMPLFGGPNFMGTLRKQVVPLRYMGFFTKSGKDMYIVGAGRDNLCYVRGLRGELSDLKPDESQGVKQKNLFLRSDFPELGPGSVVFSDVFLSEEAAREWLPDKKLEGGHGKAKSKITALHRCLPVAMYLVKRKVGEFCVKMFFEPGCTHEDLQMVSSVFKGFKISVFPGGRGHNFECYVHAKSLRSGEASLSAKEWGQIIAQVSRVACVVNLQRIAAEVLHEYVSVGFADYAFPYTMAVGGSMSLLYPNANGKASYYEMVKDDLSIGTVMPSKIVGLGTETRYAGDFSMEFDAPKGVIKEEAEASSSSSSSMWMGDGDDIERSETPDLATYGWGSDDEGEEPPTTNPEVSGDNVA